MKTFYILISFALLQINSPAQSFTFPTSGNAVNSQLPPLVAQDDVTLVTSIRSAGCTPGTGSNFQYNTSHLSTGAIYRNTSWAAGCIGSKDLIKMDFSTVTARPLGIQFSIFDVDNGSDSVSVEIYSGGSLVNYSYYLYSPTFITAHGSSPGNGNNSGQDDNRGRIDISCIDPMVIVDSIIVLKHNNRDVGGNPSQSFAAFQWNNHVVLPLKIVAFSVMQKGAQLTFNWEVFYETGIKSYQIEYSVNGQSFSETGNKITAKGITNTEVKYKQVVTIPSESNLLFFRLAAIDFEGNKTYSNTIRVNQDILIKTLVYPTNFRNNLTLSLKSDKATTGNIKLMGMDGKVYYRKSIIIDKGQNIVSIVFNDHIPPGMYLLNGYIKNASSFSYKLVKE